MALILNNLATLFEDKGNLPEAELLQREALAIRRRVLSNEHPDVLVSIGNLATVLSSRERNEEAEVLVREALQIARRSQPETPVLVAQLESVLGECLTRSGRYEEAEPLLVASYAAIRSGFHERVRPTQKALKRIIELYRAWGRTEEARKYQALLNS